MGLHLWYNKSKNKYMFCNKPFKAFLEGQISKGKPTPLLAKKKKKTNFFDAAAYYVFYT